MRTEESTIEETLKHVIYVKNDTPDITFVNVISGVSFFSYVPGETASQSPAETFGFGVHDWLLKVCFANFFVVV